ncbi:MAG TPA: UbiA family prenyltransferase, partial [Cyclobacteriaceae bacterium]|nr:UbiA family prenyltransferase [Cyclobacteriaceae bacterium]
MIAGQVHELSGFSLAMARAKSYFELMKPRLSLLVAFSCAFGYGLASRGGIHWMGLLMVTLGGFLLSGASVCINQIIERDLDKLMKRTMLRPLPTGRVTPQEATVFAALCMALSIWILWSFTNPFTVLLSLVSMVLYSFV